MMKTKILILFIALLALPIVAQAQFAYIVNNDGTITITVYTGSGGNVVIPAMINGLPVTSIGDYGVFAYDSSLTSVTIPDSVTSIGNEAFFACSNLTNVTMGNDVTRIGSLAFADCSSLANVTIPHNVTDIEESAFIDCSNLTSVTIPDNIINIAAYTFEYCSGLTNVTIGRGVSNIGGDAFASCESLTNVIIPDNVTSIQDGAFAGCSNLTGVYFEGNAPAADSDAFYDDPATVYYLPGTLGWGNTFTGVPIVQWFLPQPLILNQGPGFGVQSNQFGFTISWATNVPVVVEACTNLANPIWSPVGTNTLTGGSFYFSDPEWRNYPARFYRLLSP